MNIFNNSTVVGLFDSEKNLEWATKELQKRGFGQADSFRVINRHNLTQDAPIKEGQQGVAVPPSTGTTTPTGPGVPVTTAQTPDSEIALIQERAEETLTDLGVGDEEASFYAERVARGSSLLVAETDKDRAQEALSVMKDADARGSVS